MIGKPQQSLEKRLAGAERLHWLEQVVGMMDSRFRIPGTNLRFGLDGILGLIPWVGDAVSFTISGMLVAVMARHGASGGVLVKMIANVLADYFIGSIPVLGDLFDFAFKANRRNLRLLREHYEEGKHQGSGWGAVALVAVVLLVLIVVSVVLVVRLLDWVFSVL
jgi:hypothetical protein